MRSYLCPPLDKQKHPLFLSYFYHLLGKWGQIQESVIQVMGFSSCSTLGEPTQEELVQELCQGTPALSGLPANLVYSRCEFFLWMESTLSLETQPRAVLADGNPGPCMLPGKHQISGEHSQHTALHRGFAACKGLLLHSGGKCGFPLLVCFLFWFFL